jgi:hypothetical protein
VQGNRGVETVNTDRVAVNPELLEQFVDLYSEARGAFGKTLAIVEYRPTARRPD